MISYSQFANVLQKLENEKFFKDEFKQLLSKYQKKDCTNGTYSIDSNLESVIVFLLEELLKDDDHWISYWIYDLNFGRYFEHGMPVQNDLYVPLRTAEDLWHLLINNYKGNK